MCPLHAPTAGLLARLPLQLLGLLAPGSHVRREAELLHQVPRVVVVVSLVQAHPLRLLRRRFGAFHRDALQRRLDQLLIVAVGPSTAKPTGTPAASVSRLRLVPCLPRSVGLRPVRSPPSGALVIAPSIASHSPSSPLISSYSRSPVAQRLTKTP